MTNQGDRSVDTKIKRVFNTTASVLILIVFAVFIWCSLGNCVYAETADKNGSCAIHIGSSNVLYVDSYGEGQQVIEQLQNQFIAKKSKVIDVTFEPEITLERVSSQPVSVKSVRKDTVSVDEAVEQILDLHTRDYYGYVTEKGDTINSVAKKNHISADTVVNLNNKKYSADEKLKVGTTLIVYKDVPCVSVQTVEQSVSSKKIGFKTVYKNTSTLSRGKTKVKTKGVKGSKNVVSQVTKVNGKVVSKKVVSKKTVKKPVTKVVLRGTGNVTPKKGSTYDFATGADVVKYAKKFVGNPYVYGGTSLTKGCDCSGFVYSVYRHFGVNMPRCGQERVGKTVSVKALKKGDILFYSGHVAIYAGNGKAVHAVNERLGIKVTDVNYTGRVLKARRIFE